MPLNICFIASRCIPRGRILAYYHGLHHSTWGTPDEPLYVNFAKNPLIVVPLFALNALPIFAVEYLLRAGLAPGMMVGFVAYFVAHEEIHWRIHFGGWLPPWLEPGRRHHLQHHAAEEERFNIFFFPFSIGCSRRAPAANRIAEARQRRRLRSSGYGSAAATEFQKILGPPRTCEQQPVGHLRTRTDLSDKNSCASGAPASVKGAGLCVSLLLSTSARPIFRAARLPGSR